MARSAQAAAPGGGAGVQVRPAVASARRRRVERYHSTVRLRPSSKGVEALNPKKVAARVVSRQRRGWPSGWPVFHTRRPVNPGIRATTSARSRIVISKPAPRVTRSPPPSCSGGRQDSPPPPGQVADRDLEAGSQVHRLRPLVVLGGKQDSLRRVVHVQELAGRPSRA